MTWKNLLSNRPNNYVVAFLLLISFCTCSLILPPVSMAAPHPQTDKKDSDEEKKWEIIFEKSRAEIYRLCKNKAILKVDFLKRFFELEDRQLRKVNLLLKGETEKHVANFDAQLNSKLKSLVKTIDGAKFSVNKTEFTLDATENGDKAFIDIQLGLRLNGTYVSIMARRPRTGRGGGFQPRGIKPFDITKSKSWRASVPMLSDAQLSEFKTQATQIKKRNLHQILLLVFSDHLDLNQQQKIKMKKWISERIPRAWNHQNLIDQVENHFNVLRSTKTPPNFLDDLQKKSWLQLKNSANPLGR